MYPAFRQYYLTLQGSRASTLERAAMTGETVNLRYPAAGWQIADNAAIGGSFSPANAQGKHSLLAFAGSGERGELMRKILFLKPGRYQFTAQYEAQDSAPDSDIRWELLCLGKDANSSQWVTNAPVVKGRTRDATDFALDRNCPYQLLQLQLAGGSGQLGAEFTLRSVDIVRR
jgi:hypothetical protein